MTNFNRPSRSNRDSLAEFASTLVITAHTHAVASYTLFLDRFPFLEEVNLKLWDFLFTVAAVFVANEHLRNYGIDDATRSAMTETIDASLEEWAPNARVAYEDLRQFLYDECEKSNEAERGSEFFLSDIIGAWVAINLLGRQLKTDEECAFVRAIGFGMTAIFLEFWEHPLTD